MFNERGQYDEIRSIEPIRGSAFVEHRPRRLLSAAARNIPVIASPECGVENLAGVTTVESGDPEGLRSAILSFINHA